VVITSLVEVEEVGEVGEWIDAFDITAGKVGWDTDWTVWDTFHVERGRPQYAVLDRDFVLIEVTRDHDLAEEAAIDAL